jgi:hypothetical protein
MASNAFRRCVVALIDVTVPERVCQASTRSYSGQVAIGIGRSDQCGGQSAAIVVGDQAELDGRRPLLNCRKSGWLSSCMSRSPATIELRIITGPLKLDTPPPSAFATELSVMVLFFTTSEPMA